MPVEPLTHHGSADVRGDLTVRGDLVVEGSFALPDDAVGNAQIPTAAKIDARKLRQYWPMRGDQRGTVISDAIPLDTVNRPGTITNMRVSCITAPVGDATLTIDLMKNGASILTQVVTIDSGKANRESVTATIKSDGSQDYVAGDFFEAVTLAAIGTGALPVDLIVTVEGTTNE